MNKSKSVKISEKNEPLAIKSMKVVLDFLPERAEKILKMRFGVINGHPATLEEIGKKYGITRERVRQIIKEALNKVKRKKVKSGASIEQEIKFAINKSNGIIREEKLLNQVSDNVKAQGAVKFFLKVIDGVNSRSASAEMEKVFYVKDFDFSKWKDCKDIAKKILEKKNVSIPSDEIVKEISAADANIEKSAILDYLDVCKEVKINNFGKWGMIQWSDITPKGTREKAFLVMKEHGEPLHFTNVAEFIDKYGLSKRKSHPQTVHNELIKDTRFVLVGRGVYALAEWGYKRGTVKDVLEEIFRESGQPMSRDEILNKVLSSRKVKKSTIMINLNNFFVRVDKDRYAIKK
ncbi:MAG: Sigma-70 region 4 protein [Parcubacteria group bacterium Athens0714_25]|nr:MAG: Sigma-70 region 4 protein [Parcubacteria group bacterium Athens0714_25]